MYTINLYSLIKCIICRGDAILFDMSTIKIIIFNVIMMTAAFDTLIHCCTSYFYIALFPKDIGYDINTELKHF